MKSKKKKKKFTPMDEEKIAAGVAVYKEAIKNEEIQYEIQKRILEEQRNKPGYRYY